MELWVISALGAWAGISTYLAARESKKRRERVAIWRDAGRAAGLGHFLEPSSPWSPGLLTAWAGGQTLSILHNALRKRRVVVAEACVEGLGKVGGRATVEPLARVLALETGDLAVAAARALRATGQGAAESALLAALGRDLPELRVAAAQALGRAGSVAAVLPLKEAVSRSVFDGDLRRAAREAVAEIQARLSGASPGQLSLTEDDSGRLSLADEDPRGRLSVTDQGGRH